MKTVATFFLLLFTYTFLYADERALYEGSFETKSSGIFLPINVDGKECKFLFDTGASFVVLDKQFKSILGEPLSLKETQARTGVLFSSNRIKTPNGEVALELYKALPLKLGRLQVANRFPYLVADLQSLWPFSGVEFCGILGTSFLHQFRWEIDFEKGKIEAYVGVEPYMGKYRTRTPVYWSKAGIPYVGVEVGDKEVAFDIDLGDNGNGRMRTEYLLELKRQGKVLKTQLQDVITVSALSQSEEFRIDSIGFAGTQYPELVMQESQQNALGLAFFKRHNIVLDFPFNMLYLQHHDDYAVRQELDKSGLRVVLKEKRLIVFSIKPMQGAVIKGIQVGDEIISVNGKSGLDVYELRQLLRGKEGEKLSLELKRDDHLFDADIILGEDPL